MFRDMRRKKQALSRQEADEILDRQTHGVLALAEEGDYPYAVPLSYVRSGSTLYFHCAKTGHKLDCIRSNPKASFCVVDQDQVLPSRYTTAFRSVIAFGTVEIRKMKPKSGKPLSCSPESMPRMMTRKTAGGTLSGTGNRCAC